MESLQRDGRIGLGVEASFLTKKEGTSAFQQQAVEWGRWMKEEVVHCNIGVEKVRQESQEEGRPGGSAG